MTALPSARLQPGAAAAHRRGDAERIEAVGADAAGEQQLGRLADQGGGRPAERRIRRDEHEAAPGVGLVGEIGGCHHQVAPALPAVEQGVRNVASVWPGGCVSDRS